MSGRRSRRTPKKDADQTPKQAESDVATQMEQRLGEMMANHLEMVEQRFGEMSARFDALEADPRRALFREGTMTADDPHRHRTVPLRGAGGAMRSGSADLTALREELGAPQRSASGGRMASRSATDKGPAEGGAFAAAVAEEVADALRSRRSHRRQHSARRGSSSGSSRSSASNGSRRHRHHSPRGRGIERRESQRREHIKHPHRRYRHVMGIIRNTTKKKGGDADAALKFMRTKTALGRFGMAARLVQLVNGIHSALETDDVTLAKWYVATIYMVAEQYAVDNGSMTAAWMHSHQTSFDESEWRRELPRPSSDIEARVAKLPEAETYGAEAAYVKQINEHKTLTTNFQRSEGKNAKEK